MLEYILIITLGENSHIVQEIGATEIYLHSTIVGGREIANSDIIYTLTGFFCRFTIIGARIME